MEWESNAGKAISLSYRVRWWPCRKNSKSLKLWGSVAMQDELKGFCSFSIYIFECCFRQETDFSHLIKLLLKKISKNQVIKLIFLWALEQNIFNKYIQLQWTPSKCQRYRVDWCSNQKLLNQYAGLIKLYVRCTWF